MFDILFIGPLRVILDAATGAVVAVQDRLSGAAASFRFSPETIAAAARAARAAWESRAEA